MSALKDRQAAKNSGQTAEVADASETSPSSAELSDRPDKEKLLKLARSLKLWHSPRGDAYATVPGAGNLPVGSKALANWLTQRYWAVCQNVPGKNALDEAIRGLEGRAIYQGPEHPVFLRVAGHEGAVYLDLGRDDHQAVAITTDGWTVTSDVPVKFIRSNGTRPLPLPALGGSIEALRPFVNVADEDEFKLLIGCLVGYLSPKGPYPVLIIGGEQGSAKSTTARLVRRLIDPRDPEIRPLPSKEQNLVAAAHSGHVLSFDNLSRITGTMSDHLCRLATGGGLGGRKLYTDRDDLAEDIRRPVILNGIGLLPSRADLADRSIKVQLERIAPGARKTEAQIWAEFERVQPEVLGALCDGVSTALRRYDAIDLAELPRMADFAKWVTAAEQAFGWDDGTYVRAYQVSHERTSRDILADDPIVVSVRRLLDKNGAFEGSATKLLQKLQTHADAIGVGRNMPQAANSLSRELSRLAPELPTLGIEVEWTRGSSAKGERILSVRYSSPLVASDDEGTD